MEEDKPETSLEQIRAIWKRWDVSSNVPIWDAMEDIGKVLAGDEKQEEEPKAMSLEARLSRAKDLSDLLGVD